MATFQLAGLPSMQVANQNAPGQPSLSNYDFSQRPNVGVQLAQGLGAVGQEIQQNEAAQKLSDFQKAFGQAYAAGDRDALRQLAATNPDQIETIRQGMGFVDADRNQAMGDMSARLNIAAAQGPE
ncbi:phage DNA ejection protein, partial [Salmonella enterica]|nr:phage DNA ejection protein [Salmonella enterica]MDX9569735.1 phage DNA ejection protein [Salmonella enterica]MDX9616880.1 phage DNA ejection protein [Salmonella enterica]